jgi:hypothetical protein
MIRQLFDDNGQRLHRRPDSGLSILKTPWFHKAKPLLQEKIKFGNLSDGKESLRKFRSVSGRKYAQTSRFMMMLLFSRRNSQDSDQANNANSGISSA